MMSNKSLQTQKFLQNNFDQFGHLNDMNYKFNMASNQNQQSDYNSFSKPKSSWQGGQS